MNISFSKFDNKVFNVIKTLNFAFWLNVHLCTLNKTSAKENHAIMSLGLNYTSFSLDPSLKWSEMTEHPRSISDYTEFTKFCHKLIILSFYNINLF